MLHVVAATPTAAEAPRHSYSDWIGSDLVIFSPEVRGWRVGEARWEGDVLMDLARRVRPEIAEQLRFGSTAAIRAEIAEVVPFYDGIQDLSRQGDQFQYGGPHLCADWRFPTDGGRAHFTIVTPPSRELEPGTFLVSTRRGLPRPGDTGRGSSAVAGGPGDSCGRRRHPLWWPQAAGQPPRSDHAAVGRGRSCGRGGVLRSWWSSRRTSQKSRPRWACLTMLVSCPTRMHRGARRRPSASG